MPGSKKTTLVISDQMRAAAAHGRDRSDWERVKREVNADPDAKAMNRKIGALIARKRGRPARGELKQAISLRVPESVLARWKATGPGWRTQMVERLSS